MGQQWPQGLKGAMFQQCFLKDYDPSFQRLRPSSFPFVQMYHKNTN